MLAASGCGGNDDQADANDAESNEEATPAAGATDQGGGAAGTADFCQSAKALYDQLSAAGPAAPTSDEVQGVFEQAKALEAPAEIAADWNAILDTLVAPVVNGEIDVNDPAGTAELTERAGGLAESLQRTGTYFDTTCGFGGTATTVAADPATDPATATTAPAAITTVPAADAPATTVAAPVTTAAPTG
jgi:hypothetical protein